MKYLDALAALRKERAELRKELGTLTLGDHEYAKAKDGVDYRYMRAVRIQAIDREILKLKRENIVQCS